MMIAEKIQLNNSKMIMKKLFLIVLGVFLFVPAYGQNSCDNLYAKAIKFQQTMTIASQNQAIAYFQKAQTCYDSDAKKKLCASQIATCKNTITLIKKSNQGGGGTSKKGKNVEIEDSLTRVGNQEKEKVDTIKVNLSVNENILKFKAKGGEFKKVKVSCNVDDWKVIECPEWITCSINRDNEIVVEASKNPEKVERSGMVKIECRGVYATFAVLQAKKGLLNGIGL